MQMVNKNYKNVVAVHRGYKLNIYTITLPKNELKGKICIGIEGSGIFWLRSNDDIYINGENINHELGVASHEGDIEVPTLFNYFKQKSLRVIDVSPSDGFTIALCQDGSVWLAGYFAGIDDDDVEDEFEAEEYMLHKTFTKIESLTSHKIIGISTGFDHLLFLEQNGNVWSCGDDMHGECGNVSEGIKSKGEYDV